MQGPDFPSFDTTGSSPGDRRRLAWAAGLDPAAMLVALADTFDPDGGGPSSAEAEALRRVAVRCARQRLANAGSGRRPDDERAHAARLAAVADGLVAGAVAASDAAAVHQLNMAVAHGAAARLLDPLGRAAAGVRLRLRVRRAAAADRGAVPPLGRLAGDDRELSRVRW